MKYFRHKVVKEIWKQITTDKDSINVTEVWFASQKEQYSKDQVNYNGAC